jgi:hypothetical protein
MTEPTNRETIETANALIAVAAARAIIDADPHLSPETKRAAQLELDAMLYKCMSALTAREAQ